MRFQKKMKTIQIVEKGNQRQNKANDQKQRYGRYFAMILVLFFLIVKVNLSSRTGKWFDKTCVSSMELVIEN